MRSASYFTGQYVKALIANRSGNVDENLTPIIREAIADAFKAGQESMREREAIASVKSFGNGRHDAYNAIHSLPIEEPK